MASFSQTIIIGNVGRDAEMRYTGSGTAATELSVATSRSYKKDEEWVEETEWHTVKIYGQQAERAAEKVRKGAKILVVGRNNTRSWDDEKAGHKHWKTEIIADKFVLLDKSGSQGDALAEAYAAPAAGFGASDAAPAPVAAEGGFRAPAGGFAAQPQPAANPRASARYDDLEDLPF